jgi:isopenicillin-N epimerase
MERTWHFICKKTGAVFKQQSIALPVESKYEFVETFWTGVTPKTKIIFLSHITSPTALIFPLKEICRRARQAGFLTIVDGPHAPGQIPLDLTTLGADFYTGACHN